MEKFVNKKRIKQFTHRAMDYCKGIQDQFNRIAEIQSRHAKKKIHPFTFNAASFLGREVHQKFGSSKYLPHQSNKERERRARNRRLGRIPADQLMS